MAHQIEVKTNEIDFNTSYVGSANPLNKSYDFASPGGGSGTFYLAGFYEAPTTDANLTQASPDVGVGTANVPYAAHAFVVMGGAGSASGGTGTVEIEVSGTSITDAGVRTTSDTEVVVADITAVSLDDYLETSKKWLGTVTFTLQNSGGSTHTTYNADFNYGLCKYDDINNTSFTLVGFENVGRAGANDSGFDITLFHHVDADWTYAATGFVPGGTVIAKMSTDHSTENDLANGELFAYKRDNLAQIVDGTASEGYVIAVETGTNGSVTYMSSHIKYNI